MSEKQKTNKLIAFEKVPVQMIVVVLLALIGIVLAIGGNPFSQTKVNTTATEIDDSSIHELETRLELILGEIQGVGKVNVMLTWDSGKEVVPLMEKEANGYTPIEAGELDISMKPVVVNGVNGSEPIVIKELEPIIRGVIVVAEGADDIAIRFNLEAAVMTVLGVDEACVEIFNMQ